MQPSKHVILLTGLALSGALLGTAAFGGRDASAKVDFVRDIQPIFKSHCYACHSGDQKQGGLRLDAKTLAFQGGASGTALIPGKPDQSLLLRRILGQGGKPRMPMGFAPLSPSDTEKIRLWILQGAVWNETGKGALPWSFIPPKRPALPAVKNTAWARTPIDRFILARLEKEGLKPSPEADKATLLRRVSLDLTGVPPTPAEQDAFLADKSPAAYEKAVDRLLASPRYGERMAMDWMDGARYADSNGYQADYERHQWRWRDWVIDAYNKNMPFDQFTLEQIAGDLLPNATREQKIATGFNRNHRINTEGGVIPEEWRVETVIDRVETTSAVWLGLTMGCGRCHNHKYDPITQKEFYQFYAYFNNVPESGTGVERPVNHPPILSAPTLEQETRLADLTAKQKQQDAWLTERLTANSVASANWKLDENAAADLALNDGLIARYRLGAASSVASGNAPAPKPVGNVGGDAGRATGAVVTSGGSYVDLGPVGDFDTKQSFSYGAWVNPADGNGPPLSKMDTANDFRGWDLYLINGRPAVHIINKWPTNALKVISKTAVPNGQWTHILVTYDGTAKPEGLKIYLNGKSAPTETEVNALTDTIRTTVTAKIGTRTGMQPFSGKVDDVALYKRALSESDVQKLMKADPAKSLLAIAPEKRTDAQKQEIARLWSERNDKQYQQRAKERDTLAKEKSQVEGQISTVMVMEEMPKPRDCFILVRGQYDHHGEPVTAGIPASLGTLPPGAPNNRLGLAQWIAGPNNPLTARVAVNRFWEKFFGVGIVRTSEDFGTRSEPPSHRELLDWLATEFVRLKWDMKALQKEMVLSAAYRQSSRVTPELLHKDPENRLLARGPRFRLQAEVIRDQALAAAGLLVDRIGGPSVRPYQPDGLWEETSAYGNLHNYKHDKGDDLYRRSLYTIWKRTSAPPALAIFDVPGRETCRVRRSRTNTPLQALVLMNDETFIESARVLAQKMLLEGGATPSDRIVYAFRRAVCRRPTAEEIRILADGLQKRLAKFRSSPDAALKLVSIGDAARDPKLDVPELAAYTLTASVLLNMDETVTKK